MKVEMKNQMNFFFDKIKRNKNMGFPSKLALVIIGFFGQCIIVKSVHDTNVTTIICNSKMYSKGDTFGISANQTWAYTTLQICIFSHIKRYLDVANTFKKKEKKSTI